MNFLPLERTSVRTNAQTIRDGVLVYLLLALMSGSAVYLNSTYMSLSKFPCGLLVEMIKI